MSTSTEEIIEQLEAELNREWVDLCYQRLQALPGSEFENMDKDEQWWHNFHSWARKGYVLIPEASFKKEDVEGLNVDTIGLACHDGGTDQMGISIKDVTDIAKLKKKVWQYFGCDDQLAECEQWYLDTIKPQIEEGQLYTWPQE